MKKRRSYAAAGLGFRGPRSPATRAAADGDRVRGLEPEAARRISKSARQPGGRRGQRASRSRTFSSRATHRAALALTTRPRRYHCRKSGEQRGRRPPKSRLLPTSPSASWLWRDAFRAVLFLNTKPRSDARLAEDNESRAHRGCDSQRRYPVAPDAVRRRAHSEDTIAVYILKGRGASENDAGVEPRLCGGFWPAEPSRLVLTLLCDWSLILIRTPASLLA